MEETVQTLVHHVHLHVVANAQAVIMDAGHLAVLDHVAVNVHSIV